MASRLLSVLSPSAGPTWDGPGEGTKVQSRGEALFLAVGFNHEQNSPSPGLTGHEQMHG
jgi:hypothetical protein